jgi:hypothetical protein
MTKRFDSDEFDPSWANESFEVVDGKPAFAILVDGKVKPCGLAEWDEWLEEHRAEKIIKQDHVGTHFISTVFLGFNPAGMTDVRPHWFETMIFDKSTQGERVELGGGRFHEVKIGDIIYEERYSTLEEARQGHGVAIAWLNANPQG